MIEGRRDLFDGSPDWADSPRSVQGGRPRNDKRGGQPLDRVVRSQPVQASDRRLIPAAESARLGLQHAAAAERGGRALLAEHEGLSVNGDHRLGQEELGKLAAPGASSLPSSRASVAETSAVPR